MLSINQYVLDNILFVQQRPNQVKLLDKRTHRFYGDEVYREAVSTICKKLFFTHFGWEGEGAF